MDMKTLAEPRFIESEIRALEEEIEWQRKYMLGGQNNDKVLAYVDRLQTEIVQLRLRSESIQQAIRDNISDPEVLRMIELYQHGKTWMQINMSIYGYPDYQACRQRVVRAIAKIDFE